MNSQPSSAEAMAKRPRAKPRLSGRSVLVGVLGSLVVYAAAWTYLSYSMMREEERLAHEIGDDTALFRNWFSIGLTISTVLLVAFLAAWRWPNLRRRWRDERAMWREMRSESGRSPAP